MNDDVAETTRQGGGTEVAFHIRRVGPQQQICVRIQRRRQHAVHGEHPNGIPVSGVKNNGKADVSNLLGHILPDPDPAVFGALHAIDSTGILLIEPIRLEWVDTHAVRIVAVFQVGSGKKICAAPLIQGLPVRPHAAGGLPCGFR